MARSLTRREDRPRDAVGVRRTGGLPSPALIALHPRLGRLPSAGDILHVNPCRSTPVSEQYGSGGRVVEYKYPVSR